MILARRRGYPIYRGWGTAKAVVSSETIAALPMHLLRNIRVSHQAREEDSARVKAFYHRAGISADVQPFFDDVPSRMSEAQLVIARAGASTLADLTVIGRPSILVPFAAAMGDHQTANAQPLAASGAAVIITEAELTPSVLAAHIGAILQDETKAKAMAAAALALGQPDAATKFADLVEQIANSDTK